MCNDKQEGDGSVTGCEQSEPETELQRIINDYELRPQDAGYAASVLLFVLGTAANNPDVQIAGALTLATTLITDRKTIGKILNYFNNEQ